MAATPKRLNVTDLDFDDIKDNLKVFLKGQTEFTDYDFEGSGMNILFDVLAYTILTILHSMQTCLQMKCSLIVLPYVLLLFLMLNIGVCSNIRKSINNCNCRSCSNHN